MVGVVTEDDDGETAVGRGQTTERKQEQPKKPKVTPYHDDRHPDSHHPDTNNLPIPTKSVFDLPIKEVAINQEQIDTLASYLPKITDKCKNNFFSFFNIKNAMELHKVPADKYKGTINSFDLNIESQKVTA